MNNSKYFEWQSCVNYSTFAIHLNKQAIIQEITNDNAYLSYCKTVCSGKDIHKDLYQYIILYLLEMNEDTLVKAYNSGGIRNYLARIIYINWHSKQSRFHKINSGLEYDELETIAFVQDDSETDIMTEKLNEFDEELSKECNECIIKGVYPAAVALYSIYDIEGSYTEVSRCTGIPVTTVKRHVDSARNKATKAVNDKYTSSNR